MISMKKDAQCRTSKVAAVWALCCSPTTNNNMVANNYNSQFIYPSTYLLILHLHIITCIYRLNALTSLRLRIRPPGSAVLCKHAIMLFVLFKETMAIAHPCSDRTLDRTFRKGFSSYFRVLEHMKRTRIDVHIVLWIGEE